MTPTTDPPTAASSSVASSKPISIWRLGTYSVLQLPLAMAALPVVLNVSHYYGTVFAMNLGWLGFIFLITRAIDGIQDPLIGLFSDRLTHVRNGRLKMAIASVPIMAIGFYGVFAPPELPSHWMLIYLTAALVVVHLGYSGVSISYHSLGAELSYDYHERTRISVTREVFGIVGLLLGAAVPTLLIDKFGDVRGYAHLALIYVPILIVPALVVWLFSPTAVTPPVKSHTSGSTFWHFIAPVRNRRFRLLLLVYIINGTPVAVAASVVLFYIDDVIGAPHFMKWFILTYFAAGVVSVPLWLWLSHHTSKSMSWFCGVIVSGVGLMAAFALGTGDVVPYLVVCAVAGLGLGADYGLPPAILADVIHTEVSDSQGESGKYFGLWAMATKLMTAIGGGLALPLLDVMDYSPGAGGSHMPLLLTYALVPAGIKLLAAALLWFVRIEASRPNVADQVRAYRSRDPRPW